MAAGSASVTTGQTYSYVLRYNLVGRFVLWRDGVQVLNWTDSAGLTTGGYLALRTDSSVVSFDDIEVSRFKKYYDAGGQRVAMREAETVSFLLSDHLGSTAVTANASGTRTGELWYKPWGEYRGTAYGTTPTSYRFTGQREDATIGLYYYGARYYDPVLGRFAQADTIVPEPGNPQALNRYAYVLNNPLRYTDPTGHAECAAGDMACWQEQWKWKNRWYNAHGWFDNGNGWTTSGMAVFQDIGILLETMTEAGIRFDSGLFGISQWTFSEMALVGQGVVALANKIGGLGQLHQLLGGGATTFERVGFSGAPYLAAMVGFGRVQIAGFYQNWITVFDNAFGNDDDTRGLVVHELAHVIDFNLRINVALLGGGTHAVSPSSAFPRGPHITDYAMSYTTEYWAEAVTDWVFGATYKGVNGQYKLGVREALTTDQSKWIEHVLKGWGW